jgi:hypothetical protein
MAGEKANCRVDIAVDSTLAASAVAVVIDWAFGVLPVFMLWNLNVTRKKKIGLAAVMGLGVLASAGPLVRIPYTVSLASTHDFLCKPSDYTCWTVLIFA